MKLSLRKLNIQWTRTV